MKKKKIIIIAVIALLVIIGIVVGILSIFGKDENYETSKLSDIYNDLTSSETYTFLIKQNDENKTVYGKKRKSNCNRSISRRHSLNNNCGRRKYILYIT